jgi:hypothetical protein
MSAHEWAELIATVALRAIRELLTRPRPRRR